MTNQNEKPLPDLSKLSEPGGIYTIELQISNGSDTSCPLIVNEQMSLMISVDGGGTTYETLSIVSTAIGDTMFRIGIIPVCVFSFEFEGIVYEPPQE